MAIGNRYTFIATERVGAIASLLRIVRSRASAHSASIGLPRECAFAVAHVRSGLAPGFALQAVVADAAYGEIAQFRRALERLGIAYVAAVPYFVGARLTGTMARESPAPIANSLVPENVV